MGRQYRCDGEGHAFFHKAEADHQIITGRKPKGWSMIRMGLLSSQWEMSIEAAIATHEGRVAIGTKMEQANCRYCYVAPGEDEAEYRRIPSGTQPHETQRLSGWVVIPVRTLRRAEEIVDAAMRCAREQSIERWPDIEDRVTTLLYRWRRSGAWRRHAWHVTPRHTPARPAKKPRFTRRAARKAERLMSLRLRHPGIGRATDLPPKPPHRSSSAARPPGYRRHL